MKLPIYQIDAFTDHVFGGNPAAVVTLDAWLPDAVMQAVAAENNLAETAFVGHCTLAPYWADRLGRTRLTARQVSKRGGTLECELVGDRVFIAGRCVEFLRGVIEVPV